MSIFKIKNLKHVDILIFLASIIFIYFNLPPGICLYIIGLIIFPLSTSMLPVQILQETTSNDFLKRILSMPIKRKNFILSNFVSFFIISIVLLSILSILCLADYFLYGSDIELYLLCLYFSFILMNVMSSISISSIYITNINITSFFIIFNIIIGIVLYLTIQKIDFSFLLNNPKLLIFSSFLFLFL